MAVSTLQLDMTNSLSHELASRIPSEQHQLILTAESYLYLNSTADKHSLITGFFRSLVDCRSEASHQLLVCLINNNLSPVTQYQLRLCPEQSGYKVWLCNITYIPVVTAFNEQGYTAVSTPCSPVPKVEFRNLVASAQISAVLTRKRYSETPAQLPSKIAKQDITEPMKPVERGQQQQTKQAETSVFSEALLERIKSKVPQQYQTKFVASREQQRKQYIHSGIKTLFALVTKQVEDCEVDWYRKCNWLPNYTVASDGLKIGLFNEFKLAIEFEMEPLALTMQNKKNSDEGRRKVERLKQYLSLVNAIIESFPAQPRGLAFGEITRKNAPNSEMKKEIKKTVAYQKRIRGCQSKSERCDYED
ncbi:hypothetical protein D5018_16325 [Parashewanella curva]|uniref:Uncharacterized protein n=1 Tax=Parashewanella curva TaxID=2338552 RepID=A0A3L8PX52_9GAMM|nr:hypothetical protein [Parashewanella curva]RLV58632.1 hypothetical protein D5018_16325 [Parashewanella curva]